MHALGLPLATEALAVQRAWGTTCDALLGFDEGHEIGDGQAVRCDHEPLHLRQHRRLEEVQDVSKDMIGSTGMFLQLSAMLRP